MRRLYAGFKLEEIGWNMSVLSAYTLEMSADCLILGDTETKKYTRAVNGVRETQGAFESLSASVNASQMQLWGVQYDEAMEKRGEFLRIFEVKESKGIYKHTP